MKNEYMITRALMRSWAKEYHLHGTANIISFILLCILELISVTFLILSIVYALNWLYIYIFALGSLLAFYKLFVARFVIVANRYKLFSKTYGVSEWMRTTEFLEDEIVLTDHTSVSKLRYENVQRIKENNNVIMIYMNNNTGLRLYKDAFVEGTWEECRARILEKKTG